MTFPKKVTIVEVSPRDGLQNESQAIPTKTKIEFIDRLSQTGLSIIEVTSFVSHKWIPQLADAAEVFAGIDKKSNVRYPVLVPNLPGLTRALACDVKEIAVFTTPSETFSKKNMNCTVAESLERIAAVIEVAKKNKLFIRAYISCVLGCPYEGKMDSDKVAVLVDALCKLGCDEISLGDTIGVGTPFTTKKLLDAVLAYIPVNQLGVHFHDTYGQALTNIYAALEYGINIVDSSVAGLGGCPYAKGATGNVATEDVVYMLEGMGIETGIDLTKLVEVGRFISKKLRRVPHSKVNVAWK